MLNSLILNYSSFFNIIKVNWMLRTFLAITILRSNRLALTPRKGIGGFYQYLEFTLLFFLHEFIMFAFIVIFMYDRQKCTGRWISV